MPQSNINQKPSQEEIASKQTKPIIAPKPQIESLPSLSKRGEFNIKDLSWKLRSNVDKIYKKYGIPEKEVKEFANNVKKYDISHGGYLHPSESAKLEKPLKNKGDTKSKNWLKILSDPEIFNK